MNIQQSEIVYTKPFGKSAERSLKLHASTGEFDFMVELEYFRHPCDAVDHKNMPIDFDFLSATTCVYCIVFVVCGVHCTM